MEAVTFTVHRQHRQGYQKHAYQLDLHCSTRKVGLDWRHPPNRGRQGYSTSIAHTLDGDRNQHDNIAIYIT